VTEDKKRAKAEKPGPEHADCGDDRERLRVGSPTDAALAALLEAGPEAVDHLLKAAQELLLAAKAVVDAGERAVETHRDTANTARANDAPDREPRVRRIDLA
jgi:hypothetical protein